MRPAEDTGPSSGADTSAAASGDEGDEGDVPDTTGLGLPGADTIPARAAGADSLLEMTAGAPSRGPEDAAVVVVEFSDFECPFCARAHDTVERVMRGRPDIRLVYVQFPILALHPGAMLPSEASLEAHRQGKFWEYHDALFKHGPPLERPTLLRLGRQVGLDVKALAKALDAGTHREQVKREIAIGDGLVITGTPTFFINGYRLVGAQPYETFVMVYNLLLRASRRDDLALAAPPIPR
ncbi:MAG: thioredoxin domain-containing protein [Gemmatimonadetes bacterium]|nr:thioredoxin domain-containing protein [Gemmatimonadota bacterium]